MWRVCKYMTGDKWLYRFSSLPWNETERDCSNRAFVAIETSATLTVLDFTAGSQLEILPSVNGVPAQLDVPWSPIALAHFKRVYPLSCFRLMYFCRSFWLSIWQRQWAFTMEAESSKFRAFTLKDSIFLHGKKRTFCLVGFWLIRLISTFMNNLDPTRVVSFVRDLNLKPSAHRHYTAGSNLQFLNKNRKLN